MESKEFAGRIKKAFELYKQLEDIENGLEKLIDRPVTVKLESGERYGHILFINAETGIVTIEFGLRTATDYGVGLYHFSDFISNKIVFDEL